MLNRSRFPFLVFMFILASAEVLWAGSVSEQISSMVERFIRSRCEADSLVLALNLPEPLPVLKNGDVLTYYVDCNRTADQLSGRIILPVRIVSGERTLRTVYVTATIRRFKRVCRARRLIPRHAEMGEADLEVAMCEVTRLVSLPYKEKGDLFGKRVTRVVSRGRVITEDMVEHVPLIGRGDRIRILVRHENLTVTTTGFALEDGWMGDQIRVRHADGRREIVGRVQGISLVEVGS